MFAFLLFFVILPALFIIYGIINILASKYNWTIVLIISQWTLTPFDLAFGKKFVKDEETARKDCMIYGTILTIIGICAFLGSIIIYTMWIVNR